MKAYSGTVYLSLFKSLYLGLGWGQDGEGIFTMPIGLYKEKALKYS